jgi:hypothetical protein
MAVPSDDVPFEWIVSQEDVDDLYQRLDNVSRCSVGCLPSLSAFRTDAVPLHAAPEPP